MACKLTAMIIIASFGTTGAVEAAGSATAGKSKAFECAGCHGDMGQGMGSYPALAGKPVAGWSRRYRISNLARRHP